MRYAKIRKMDISNGPGIRVSIFVQGCSFHCKGCFNEDTWNFDGGKEFTDEIFDKLIELCKSKHVQGLSILGGEPLHPKNVLIVYDIIKRFKENCPNKDIWLWTGYKYEDLTGVLDNPQRQTIFNVDVVVDGQFVLDKANPNLKYRGSSNQRVIDVKETLKTGNIILKENL